MAIKTSEGGSEFSTTVGTAYYLNKPSCEYALRLLLRTIYRDQITAGLPSEIPVAHKEGYNVDTGDFHDCCVVYLPNRPYILCIMGMKPPARRRTG